MHVHPANLEPAVKFDNEVDILKVVAAKHVMKSNNKREREGGRDGALDQRILNQEIGRPRVQGLTLPLGANARNHQHQ